MTAESRSFFRRHFIIWSLITIYLVIIDPIEGRLPAQTVGTLLIMLSYILPFYSLTYYVISKFWEKSYLQFAIAFVVLYIIYSSIDVINFYWVIPYFGGVNVYENYGIEKVFSEGLLFFFIISLVSFTVFYNHLAVEKLKLQNHREKSLLIKELSFLKDQFNSHITFNFLNFCYSQVHQTVPKVADAIELFSNLLRYSLSLKPDQKISLSDEVEYIKTYIQLQKLLTSKVYVKFDVIGVPDGILILPRILMSFVENSFKHGLLNNQEDPLLINLIIDENVCFQVRNRKNAQTRILKTGVGQDNVRQILEIFYKNMYDLSIEDGDNYYTLKLLLKV